MHLTHLKFRRNKLGYHGVKASLNLKFEFHTLSRDLSDLILPNFFSVKLKVCFEEFE